MVGSTMMGLRREWTYAMCFRRLNRSVITAGSICWLCTRHLSSLTSCQRFFVTFRCQRRDVRGMRMEYALTMRPAACAQLFRAVAVVESGETAGLEDGSRVARAVAEHGAGVGA